MEAEKGPGLDGVASSKRTEEPQRLMVYAGASRSTGTVMWCRADRFLEARKRGSEN
jgi:hypothetical protein